MYLHMTVEELETKLCQEIKAATRQAYRKDIVDMPAIKLHLIKAQNILFALDHKKTKRS